MRQLSVLALIAIPLAGCSWAENVGGHINPDSLGLSGRCAAVMKAATPYADLDIGKTTSQNKGPNLITAQVEAQRTDHPNDAGLPRALTADCEFTDTVLTSFHLTGLGPVN